MTPNVSKQVIAILMRAMAMLALVMAMVPAFARAAAPLKVRMYNVDRGSSTTTLRPSLVITNTGSAAIKLSDVKLRYYFASDGAAGQTVSCAAASVNCPNVASNVQQMTGANGADSYLEITFRNGAGSLPAGTSTAVEVKIQRTRGSYSQPGDYSFNPESPSPADWDRVTAYVKGALVWGTTPTGQTSSSMKFLIVTAKPLHDAGTVATALNTYEADLRNEGWTTAAVTVDASSGSTPDFVTASAPALKNVIQGYFTGFQGFVLIGSAPSLPTAHWENSPAENTKTATDVYFADSSTWTDSDGDGLFESYVPNPADPAHPIFVGQAYAPEMIWGRISAGALAGGDAAAEAAKVTAYLGKVHRFRTAGSNLTLAQQRRATFFTDDDWGSTAAFGAQTMADIRAVYNDSFTTPQVLAQELELGAAYFSIGSHSGRDPQGRFGFGISTWEEGQAGSAYFGIDELHAITPRAHYVNVASCGASSYEAPSIVNALLFDNDYVLNVTGDLGSFGIWPGPDFYDRMSTANIGTAFKELMQDLAQPDGANAPLVMHALLGDPTIRYTWPNRSGNTTPTLTNYDDLNRLEAGVGSEIRVPLNVNDPDPLAVLGFSFTGLPSGARFDDATRTLIWTPAASDAGRTFPVTLVISDGANTYTTSFTMYASYLRSGLLRSIDGWTVAPGSVVLQPDGDPKHQGVRALVADATDPLNPVRSAISQTVAVQAGTDYTLSLYCWSDVLASGAPVSGLPEGARVRILELGLDVPCADGLTKFGFATGGNATLTVELDAGTAAQPATGKVFFSNLYVAQAGNLGFELVQDGLPKNWTTSSSVPAATTFAVDSAPAPVFDGLHSARISASAAVDASFGYVPIAVKTNTTYTLTAKVRTEGISEGRGANLTVLSGPGWAASTGMTNTEDWQTLILEISTGDSPLIYVWARLGCWSGWGGPSSGTAWFDDLTLSEKAP